MRSIFATLLSVFFVVFLFLPEKGFGQVNDTSQKVVRAINSSVIVKNAPNTNAQNLDILKKEAILKLSEQKKVQDSLKQALEDEYTKQKQKQQEELKAKELIAADLRSGNEDITRENLIMTTNTIVFFSVLLGVIILILVNRFRVLSNSRILLDNTGNILNEMEKETDKIPGMMKSISGIQKIYSECDEHVKTASPLFSSIVADKNHQLFKPTKSLISNTSSVLHLLTSRIDKADDIKVATNLNHLIEESANQAFFSIKSQLPEFNCRLVKDLEKILPEVEVFPEEIRFVLFNLFENAFHAVWKKRDHSPKGYEPTVTVSSRKLPRFVQIRVKDNGIGIPSKAQDQVFEPFHSTRKSDKSPGLGLSESHRIILTQHKGELYIESDLANSTDFIIRFPIATIQ